MAKLLARLASGVDIGSAGNNLYIGTPVPSGLTGTNNVAVGANAALNLTTGIGNLAIGGNALLAATSADYNTAIGGAALLALTEGDYNTAIGGGALQGITTATFNTGVGVNAGYSITTGFANIVFGTNVAPSLITGSECIIMGNDADVSATDASYGIAMGKSAVCASNQFSISYKISKITLHGESSTTVGRAMGEIQTAWVDATDASRKARMSLHAYDTAVREGMRIEGGGSAPHIGFYGAAAVAKPSVTGSRGGNAALASLLTSLANLGLITDSTTA